MKVEALGASGGRAPGHALSSFLIDKTMLMDVGGTCSVLDQKAQLKIDHILLSHPHLDHIYSLTFLLETMSINRTKPVELISSREVLKIIANDFLNDVIWPDFTKIKPDGKTPLLKYRPIPTGKMIKVGAYKIEAIDVNHPVPAVGFIISDKEGTLFYTGDMGPTPAVWKKIKALHTKVDALLTELSFPNHMEALAVISGHLTPNMLENGMIEAEIVDTPVYLTHMKPMYLKILIKELDRLPRKNINVLKDGQSFKVKTKKTK